MAQLIENADDIVNILGWQNLVRMNLKLLNQELFEPLSPEEKNVVALFEPSKSVSADELSIYSAD